MPTSPSRASLSSRLGELLQWLARAVLRRPQTADRPYWRPPPDHLHTGNLTFVRRLGGKTLRLERCYGLSLLWLLYYWGQSLDTMPRILAESILRTLDQIAYRTPTLADMIVAVWRRSEERPPS